jgi:UPF0755 protein
MEGSQDRGRLRRFGRGWWFLFGVFIVAVLAVVATTFTPVSQKEKWVNVVITKGKTPLEIGHLLQDEGLVRSAYGFVFCTRLQGTSRRLIPGEYRLSPTMSLWHIAQVIASGEVVARSVTVPEGYTVDQIADLFAAKGLVDKKKFVAIAKRDGKRFTGILPLIESSNLEGYLFPDTYQASRGDDEVAVISMMLKDFYRRFRSEKLPSPPEADYSDYDCLKIASIVEREAKLPTERALIAGVLYNRLKRGMKLQADATVQYALGKHKTRLLYEDTLVDSPYNTYLHAGLPPTPVCNPGIASIRAAYEPGKTGYLYYFALSDGSHHFSRSYAEHIEAQHRLRGR